MNRRGFLRLLAAIPIIRDIPFVTPLDGPKFSSNQRISPAEWTRRTRHGGGGGGGGSGGIVIVIMEPATTLTITAEGGAGGKAHEPVGEHGGRGGPGSPGWPFSFRGADGIPHKYAIRDRTHKI